MSLNLCIDWGNTNVKAAIFDNGQLHKQFVFSEEAATEKVSGILSLFQPNRAIFSSVAKDQVEFKHMLKSSIPSLVSLDSYTKLPINNAYLSPDTLGADRLALVTAAHLLHPDKNNLVISLGTCITYNLVQKNKTFRGGAISPGLRMRLQAMHHFTDMLPEVAPDEDALLLGYDTETCMQSGAVNGMALEIDGMIKTYADQYPDFNAILTGGDLPFFAAKIKSRIFADPDILLKGLNLILNYNVSSH